MPAVRITTVARERDVLCVRRPGRTAQMWYACTSENGREIAVKVQSHDFAAMEIVGIEQRTAIGSQTHALHVPQNITKGLSRSPSTLMPTGVYGEQARAIASRLHDIA